MINDPIDTKNNLKSYIKNSIFKLDDKYLDRLILGTELDSLLSDDAQLSINLNEQTTHEPTPYHFILAFLEFINPSKNDVVFDLGSGYGRVVLFGASISEARFIGIELINNRVTFSKERAKKLGLMNATFLELNVRSADLSLGNIFFLFNPFSEETLHIVGSKLKDVAAKKHIKIVCWGGMSIYNYFKNEKWLTEEQPPKNLCIKKLSYFYSL